MEFPTAETSFDVGGAVELARVNKFFGSAYRVVAEELVKVTANTAFGSRK